MVITHHFFFGSAMFYWGDIPLFPVSQPQQEVKTNTFKVRKSLLSPELVSPLEASPLFLFWGQLKIWDFSFTVTFGYSHQQDKIG